MFIACSLNFVSAQTNYYGSSGGNIIDIVHSTQENNVLIDSVFEKNIVKYTNSKVMVFGKKNRIASGAWILVESISPYVQWIIFFGMSLSVIMIIYNGFLIVTDPGGDKIKSAKENIKNIVIGVLVLGGFYFIMRVVSGLLLKLIGG